MPWTFQPADDQYDACYTYTDETDAWEVGYVQQTRDRKFLAYYWEKPVAGHEDEDDIASVFIGEFLDLKCAQIAVVAHT